MEERYKFYKRKFKNALEPILVMLINRKKLMAGENWKASVDSTQNSVINNPAEFLGDNLPEKKTTNSIVQIIFKEFLRAKR